MNRLAGRVALVTGAAGGLGRSLSARLAEEGADLVLVDIEDPAGTAGLVRGLGRRAVVAVGDVRDAAAMETSAAVGTAELGRLDVVVVNAGIASRGALMELGDQEWDDMLAVTLTGALNTVRACVPHLRRVGGGSVVVVNSAAGLRPYRDLGHYTAAKHGLVGLAKSLALELGPEWIRVNSVHPTAIATPMIHDEASLRRYRPDLENPTVEDAAAVMVGKHVLPVPWVQPVDVSNAVLFLASDEARYVTGSHLSVDAGRSLT